MLTHARIAAAVLVGLFSFQTAHAAQVISLSFSQLVDRADVIVLGQVTDLIAERPNHNPKRIRTRVTVAVQEFLKWRGQVPVAKAITVYIPGGEVGRFGQKVPGAPQLEKGDGVLLHLRFSHRGELQVVGLAQGCQHLEVHEDVLHAVRNNKGIHYVAPSPNQSEGNTEVHRLPIEREPLGPLLKRIRARVTQLPR